jgi:ankyrin repeat protein
LIESGAKVNAADRHGYTPLHYAANIDFGDTEMVELLLRAGADPRARGKTGKTALRLARELRYPDIVRALEGPLPRR